MSGKVIAATYSAADAAALLGISRWSVTRAVKRKEIPAICIGRRILIPSW
jgi:excisionase family DNA binding protein